MNKQKLLTSIKRDIEFTSGNYAQMYNRLKLNDSISKFLITYYSTVSIIYGLFPLFFEDKIVYLTGLDFLMMSLSVVVLIASLLILGINCLGIPVISWQTPAGYLEAILFFVFICFIFRTFSANKYRRRNICRIFKYKCVFRNEISCISYFRYVFLASLSSFV